jgi:hydroxymethyl cephem carbamoyltransferase
VLSLESEKDSYPRYSRITLATTLDIALQLDQLPDIIAVGGWHGEGALIERSIGAGYHGLAGPTREPIKFFGKDVELISSSHDRSHLMMALGMAPHGEHGEQAVLIWEGQTGEFVTVDRDLKITRRISVLSEPGGRYAALFALADPTFPDCGALPRLNDAGKLMALAGFGDPDCDDPALLDLVDRLLKADSFYPVPKDSFRDSKVYNAGVEAEVTKDAAAMLSRRMFDLFAQAAMSSIPAGIPLRISGGCGLNCEWNVAWRELGHFSSVFVPPCTNDSGSAIGTAVDALATVTGDPYIEWDVYSGLDFVHDVIPNPARWSAMGRDDAELALALASNRVIAWVQGRWEIGPRALGNRSLLAAPFELGMRDTLNRIKKRESYRPIAPCCRTEDLSELFDGEFADPYMLYFRRVRSSRLAAVTHVDGSARVQTVSQETNSALHGLLSAFAVRTGAGVLCNTSLNFNGFGFINRMSDLIAFCEARGIHDIVVGDSWYRHVAAERALT